MVVDQLENKVAKSVKRGKSVQARRVCATVSLGIEFGLITDSHLSRPTGMTGTAKRPNSKLFNRSLRTATMVTIMMTTMLWSMTLHPSRISGNRNPHMSRKTWLPMTTLAMTRMKRSLETGMDDCSIVQGK